MGRQPRWKGELGTPEEQFLNKRRLLVSEAGRAFSENGFHNTSLDDIASALGITKTIVYHYFKNKQDILMECFAIGFEVADDALEQALAASTDGLGRVEIFVRHYVESVASATGACAATLEMKSVPPEERPRIQAEKRAFDNRLRELVQAGIDDGSIDAIDPMLAVNWIMGAAQTVPRWFRSDRRLTATDVATQYADLARRMLERKASR